MTEMLKIMVPGGIKFNQIGVVVKDLEKAIDFYSTNFGIGPFRIINPRNWKIILRGKPKIIHARIAVTDDKNFGVQFELIEVPEEETIYSEFVRTCGEGLHHLGFGVDDFEGEVTKWKKHGFKVIQRSNPGGPGGWAYMDTNKVAGVIFELRKSTSVSKE
ncbi:VOC family protein [Candidatus Bathyarchaeota archaeon]|nr:VOC family protein [Candidatus Bathyarchaeota archaeon]